MLYFYSFLYICSRASQYDEELLAASIVKSKRYDGTSRKIFPSQTVRPNMQSSSFSVVLESDNDTPTDRIARFYNPSAAGLTMSKATKFAKAFEQHTQSKVTHKPALAPDAFVAAAKIADIAMNGSPSKRVKVTDIRIKFEEPSSRINATSKNKIIFPTLMSPSKNGVVNYDDWDPEPISIDVEDPLAKISQNIIIQRMHKTIESVLKNGVQSSASKNVPVALIPARMVENILSRLRLQYISSENNSIQQLVHDEMIAIEYAYSLIAARASVESTLLDPMESCSMGISLSRLRDTCERDLWINQEYQVAEWKLLRQTGIDRGHVNQMFMISESLICSFLPIMLNIQSIWMKNTLPLSWWDTMKSSNKVNYCSLLLTDVNDSNMRSKFPMTIPEFLSHVDVYSKSVREGLTEFWLTEVGNRLSKYIANMTVTDGKCTYMDDDDLVLNDVLQNSFIIDEKESSSIDMKSLSQTAMANRIAFEMGGTTHTITSTHKPNKAIDTRKKIKIASKAEKCLDAAAVLLSRQLRCMCESTLNSLTDLFEKLLNPITAQYSILIVTLKARKLSTKEFAIDFNDSMEVCLQPDVSDTKAALVQCVKILIASCRDMQRPENMNLFSSTIGGANHHMLVEFLRTNHSRRLNACSVSFSDEIVSHCIHRMNSALDAFCEAPQQLLANFEVLNEVLSGQLGEKVMLAIEQCKTSIDHSENLLKLSELCSELDSLVEQVKNVVPDVSSFPVFEVRSLELKESLIKYIRSLHSHIMDMVVVDNREHMLSLCTQYQDISTILERKPADEAELRELFLFQNKIAASKNELSEEYKVLCFARVTFLLENKHKFNREDVTSLLATHGWPISLEAVLRKSYEQTSESKLGLEKILAEEQRSLDKDILELFKRVDNLAEQQANQYQVNKIIKLNLNM